MSATLLDRLARRWRRRRLAAAVVTAAAAALPLAALLAVAPGGAAWRAGALAVALVGLVAAALRVGGRAVPAAAVAAHLDRRVPALMESAELLLPGPELPPLADLQRRRLLAALPEPAEAALARTLPWAPLRRAAVRLGAAAGVAALVLWAGSRDTAAAPSVPAAPGVATRAAAPASPLLRELRVTVRPPAYTGRPARHGDALGVQVEEGGTVAWRVRADDSVEDAWMLVDEEQEVPLRREGDVWVAARQVREPHLVRLVLRAAGREPWRSAPGRLEVLADRPPVVELLAPETLLERDATAPGSVGLDVAISDDHGVAGGELLLTVASGEDEQVEFRELRQPVGLRAGPARQRLRRTIDLAALGLGPGSELFVRVEVRDGRQPQANVSRSPTVIVRIPVERQESADLAGLPSLVGPELLRSQRQILVDTEKLVAETPRLSRADVDRRSRALALDQRALRLRYGTLLGQEVEDGRVIEADPGHDHEGEGDSPGAAMEAVPEGLAHMHDSEESATFFPDPIRRQLVAMLGAMWDSERELATIAPRAALPHERRALELLKEVQQAARIYVARSGAETTPLDPARRLSGELDDLGDLSGHQPPPPDDPVVAAAEGVLAALAANGRAREADLAQVRGALAALARGGDAAALDALPALDELEAGGPPGAGRRAALVRGLWGLLPEPELPPRRTAPAGTLWERYRRELAEAGAP